MAELCLFIGKGGVGKTTTSAAYAMHAASAAPRPSVLLISTDPAHSLADVLQVSLRDRPRQISSRLYAWQINAEKQFARFLRRERGSLVQLLERGTLFTREDIEPLLDTTLPGMAEMAALVAIHDLLEGGAYDQIVVDTAPVGHTLRLFQMPQHFARLLRFLQLAGDRDRVLAQTFGGRSPASPGFVAEWQRMVARVEQALTRGRVFLVTTPEPFALAESVRARDALARGAPPVAPYAVVLNRIVNTGDACRACAAAVTAARKSRSFLERDFPRVPVLTAEDSGNPVLGGADLRAFGAHVFAGRKLRLSITPPAVREVRLRSAPWPRLTTPLALTVGKGGVGKTTISAALAYHHRRVTQRRVLVCSTDPAPSLRDVFQAEIGDRETTVLGDSGLRALELDAEAGFHQWAEPMRARLGETMSAEQSGIHMELTFEKQLFAALLDVVPPGVDELFAIFRILELLSGAHPRVVLDMAPTGHALELLAMPQRMLVWSRLLLKTLAPHRTLPFAREAGVEITSVGLQVRRLLKVLTDARSAQLWPVMLAETLPDRETARLLRATAGLGVATAGLFVNRVLLAGEVGGCPRCRRVHAWHMHTLRRVQRLSREGPVYITPDRPGGIAGKRSLKGFTDQLWRLA